jgi:hypothetical protein
MLGYFVIDNSTPPSAVNNKGSSVRFPVIFDIQKIDACCDRCYQYNGNYDVDSDPAFT